MTYDYDIGIICRSEEQARQAMDKLATDGCRWAGGESADTLHWQRNGVTYFVTPDKKIRYSARIVTTTREHNVQELVSAEEFLSRGSIEIDVNDYL